MYCAPEVLFERSGDHVSGDPVAASWGNLGHDVRRVANGLRLEATSLWPCSSTASPKPEEQPVVRTLRRLSLWLEGREPTVEDGIGEVVGG